MNDLLEKLNSWWVLLSGVAVGIGTLRTWVYLKDYNKEELISESKKGTKVNDNQGDAAIAETINTLKLQISTLFNDNDVLAEMNVALKKKINEQAIEIDVQKSKIERCAIAFKQLEAMCDEHCVKADFCKEKINKIMFQLQINKDEQAS